MSKLAYLFPGQGAQKVGMGADLYQNHPGLRALFDEADDALSFSLSKIMFNGPDSQLAQTAVTQPAILLHSVACFRLLREIGAPQPSYVAGHSLGEYSALVMADVMTFRDALLAVHFRGKAMQEAVPLGAGTMAAVLGVDIALLKETCKETQDSGHYVDIANLNGPDQTVIAGTLEGVKLCVERLKYKGVKRTLMLNVSAPFHCQLMQPAAEQLRAYLQQVSMQDAKIAVVNNVEAKPVKSASQIRRLLVEQVTKPVRFTETIEFLRREKVGTMIECGPGKVLSGIIRRMVQDVTLMQVEDVASAERALEEVKHAS